MAFVVTPQQEEVLRILDFEGEQEQNRLNLHWSSALVISEEEVVGFRRPALHVKYFAKVVELSVDVSHNFDRWLQF